MADVGQKKIEGKKKKKKDLFLALQRLTNVRTNVCFL